MGVAFFAATALAFGCTHSDAQRSHAVAVHVRSIGFDSLTHTPVLILEEDEGSRVLPIWIGLAEARSIAAEIEGVESRRPNTHDLARNLILGLDGEIQRIVVNDLRDGIYFATIDLRVDGRSVAIDSRPSDAIAIAIRDGATLFVDESLFDETRDEPGSDDGGEEVRRRAPLEPAPARGAPATPRPHPSILVGNPLAPAAPASARP